MADTPRTASAGSSRSIDAPASMGADLTMVPGIGIFRETMGAADRTPQSQAEIDAELSAKVAQLMDMANSSGDPEISAVLLRAAGELSALRGNPNARVLMGEVLSKPDVNKAVSVAVAGGAIGGSASGAMPTSEQLYRGPYVRDGYVTDLDSFAKHWGYDPNVLHEVNALLQDSSVLHNDAVVLNGWGIAGQLDPDGVAARLDNAKGKGPVGVAVSFAGQVAACLQGGVTPAQKKAMLAALDQMYKDPHVAEQLPDKEQLKYLLEAYPEQFVHLGLDKNSVTAAALQQSFDLAQQADQKRYALATQGMSGEELATLREVADGMNLDTTRPMNEWLADLRQKMPTSLDEAKQIYKIPSDQRTPEQAAKLSLATVNMRVEQVEAIKFTSTMIKAMDQAFKDNPAEKDKVFYGSNMNGPNPTYVSTADRLKVLEDVYAEANEGKRFSPEQREAVMKTIGMLQTPADFGALVAVSADVQKTGSMESFVSLQTRMLEARAKELSPEEQAANEKTLAAIADLKNGKPANYEEAVYKASTDYYFGVDDGSVKSVLAVASGRLSLAEQARLRAIEEANNIGTTEAEYRANVKADADARAKDVRLYLEYPRKYAQAEAPGDNVVEGREEKATAYRLRMAAENYYYEQALHTLSNGTAEGFSPIYDEGAQKWADLRMARDAGQIGMGEYAEQVKAIRQSYVQEPLVAANAASVDAKAADELAAPTPSGASLELDRALVAAGFKVPSNLLQQVSLQAQKEPVDRPLSELLEMYYKNPGAYSKDSPDPAARAVYERVRQFHMDRNLQMANTRLPESVKQRGAKILEEYAREDTEADEKSIKAAAANRAPGEPLPESLQKVVDAQKAVEASENGIDKAKKAAKSVSGKVTGAQEANADEEKAPPPVPVQASSVAQSGGVGHA